jgi:hypothetical protein
MNLSKLLAGAGVLALLAFLGWLAISRVEARAYEAGRLSVVAQVAAAEAKGSSDALAAYARGVEASAGHQRAFEAWASGVLGPSKETITRETIKYAASAAGTALCFDVDGLRAANSDIAAAARTAFAADPAGLADPVPTLPIDPR